MAKKSIRVQIEIEVQSVTCPGVWLCPNGNVSLQIYMLDSCIQTALLAPVFPLFIDEKFIFYKTFASVHKLCQLQHTFNKEHLYAELIQWKDCEVGNVLSTFETSLSELLFPSSCDVDLLMEPTKNYPGIISPKIEICTKTTIDEVCTLDNNKSQSQVINPKTLSSKECKKVNVRNQRQIRVCHSVPYHRRKVLCDKEKLKGNLKPYISASKPHICSDIYQKPSGASTSCYCKPNSKTKRKEGKSKKSTCRNDEYLRSNKNFSRSFDNRSQPNCQICSNYNQRFDTMASLCPTAESVDDDEDQTLDEIMKKFETETEKSCSFSKLTSSHRKKVLKRKLESSNDFESNCKQPSEMFKKTIASRKGTKNPESSKRTRCKCVSKTLSSSTNLKNKKQSVVADCTRFCENQTNAVLEDLKKCFQKKNKKKQKKTPETKEDSFSIRIPQKTLRDNSKKLYKKSNNDIYNYNPTISNICNFQSKLHMMNDFDSILSKYCSSNTNLSPSNSLIGYLSNENLKSKKCSCVNLKKSCSQFKIGKSNSRKFDNDVRLVKRSKCLMNFEDELKPKCSCSGTLPKRVTSKTNRKHPFQKQINVREKQSSIKFDEDTNWCMYFGAPCKVFSDKISDDCLDLDCCSNVVLPKKSSEGILQKGYSTDDLKNSCYSISDDSSDDERINVRMAFLDEKQSFTDKFNKFCNSLQEKMNINRYILFRENHCEC